MNSISVFYTELCFFGIFCRGGGFEAYVVLWNLYGGNTCGGFCEWIWEVRSGSRDSKR